MHVKIWYLKTLKTLIMRYYQKFVTTFAGKKPALLLTAAFFTLSSMTANRTNFSGEWKLNESKSNHGHLLCIYDGGDRMRSKTMKIAEHADFLTVDVASSFPNAALVIRQEKLTFNGKESEFTLMGRGKKSTVKWSDDGQTMTVNSVVYLDINGEKTEFKVTEVWKLINNGKSISLQANTKSTYGEDAMKLVYDKAS